MSASFLCTGYRLAETRTRDLLYLSTNPKYSTYFHQVSRSNIPQFLPHCYWITIVLASQLLDYKSSSLPVFGLQEFLPPSYCITIVLASQLLNYNSSCLPVIGLQEFLPPSFWITIVLASLLLYYNSSCLPGIGL